VATSLTRCPTCGRETETLDDGRCHYCGQVKPLAADVPMTPAAPSSARDDMRPQLVAAGVAALIALVGIVFGSTILVVIAAVLLIASVVAKIVADGW
jgi:hypothetical protein